MPRAAAVVRPAARLIGAPIVAAVLALPLAAPAQAMIQITIDKTTQHMSVAIDGEPKYEWPVSTGRPGYDTPNGTFKVNRMDASHFSQEWDNAPMPHTMFFDLRGHAIHGFFDVKHLGMAVSHGCVRLAPANAAVLFSLVKAEGMANTTVVVGGSTPGGAVAGRAVEPVATEASPPPGYPPQGYYAQPGYGQPGYGQPAYGQRVYVQPGYGQPYYPQPYNGAPVYRQW